MIGTAPARSFCIISWRTSPTYFSSLIVYRVFLCVVLFFCPFINVLLFIFKLFCCFCSIFQTMLFELQCSARALSQQSFLYIFAGFFFFLDLNSSCPGFLKVFQMFQHWLLCLSFSVQSLHLTIFRAMFLVC